MPKAILYKLVKWMLIFFLMVSVAVSDFAAVTHISEEADSESPSWVAVELPNFIFYEERGWYHSYDTFAKVDRISGNCTDLMVRAVRECPDGGSVALKAGVYFCDVFVSKKLCIRGEGRAATIIHGTITFDSTPVSGTPVCQHSLLQGLKLDGLGVISVGVGYESRVPSVPLITVRDVDVENYSERGISFVNASDCLFENVVVGNCPVGIHYTTDHNFGRIRSCEVLNYGKAGIYTDAQIYLSDTVFSAVQTSPETADLVLDNAFGTIIGCWFENNKPAPYVPCIDMPSTCYRPLALVGCFFANRGGAIVKVRSACEVSVVGCFFSQQSNAGEGCCVEIVQGRVIWSGNEVDTAFSTTLVQSWSALS